jgi:hypothetical protein
VKRSWLCIAAIGSVVGACAEPNPPPAPAAAAQPAAVSASPTAEATSLVPASGGPVTFNLPPAAIDYNPPGTPGYVITPGDTVGRRNTQIPRPGGAPAF